MMDPLFPEDQAFDDDGCEEGRAASPNLILRLNAEDLRRLDRESEATGFTRGRWVMALIHKTLHGRPQFNRAERIDLSQIAKALKQMDARLAKSARSLEDMLANAGVLAQRLGEVERMRDQVQTLAGLLDKAFQGNEAYWQTVADEGEPMDAGKKVTHIRHDAKRRS